MSPLLAAAIFWIAVACCVVAQAAIVRSVLLARGGSTRVRRAAELLWAVLPAIALATVLVLTWRTMHGAGADHSHPDAALPPVRAAAT